MSDLDNIDSRIMAQEQLIVDTMDFIYGQMKEKGISQSDMAKAIGVSKSRMSKIFHGADNVTLRTLSDMFHAVGIRPSIIDRDKIIEEDRMQEIATSSFNMMLRDDFAKAALQGILMQEGVSTNEHDISVDAERSYRYADTMLQERKKYVD